METFVRLLGQPTITHDGDTTFLRAEVRFRLVAILAHRGAPVDRDRLAALFWPDRDSATARRNLRKLVFDLHSFGWSAGLASTRATLGWAVATDVALFERAVADRRFEDVLRLYGGPFLDGLDDPSNNEVAAFIHGERTRLARCWRHAALQRLAGLVHEPAASLALAGRLLAADPLDEDALVASLHALHALGNTCEAVRLYRSYERRLATGLGIAPSPKLRALVPSTGASVALAATARRAPAGAPPAHATPPSAFVGRAPEIRQLATMLAREECRLVTIVGPGGIGKSRLAKAALATIEPDFAAGTWWIPLDDRERAEQVADDIAQILGVDVGQGDPLPGIGTSLRAARALLVLDNAERIEDLAGFIGRLLAAAPGVKVVATSRRRLDARGEWVLPLAGLPVPAADPVAGDAAGHAAVRLFAAHARAAKPAFDLAPALAPVVRIVRALGGHPLAIELAARWLRWLPIAGLEAEIRASLDLLECDEEGAERPEHRSVRATFEGSWRHLAPDEQRAFAMLSVFAGPFARRVAHEVAGATLAGLLSLVDRSLVQTEENGGFSLHPLLQQFGREKCRELGLHEVAADRHAAFFHRLLGTAGAAGAADARLDPIEHDLANCRAAWRWSIARRDTGALAASTAPLLQFFLARGRLGDGLAMFGEAASGIDARCAGDQAAAAGLLLAIARLQNRRGALRDAAATARRALKLARPLGLDDVASGCLEVFLQSTWQRGLFPGAQRHVEEGLRRARADDDTGATAAFLACAGMLEKVQGNHQRAQQHFAEAVRCRRQLGESSGLAWLLKDLGNVHCVRGEWDLALAAFQEGLEVCERTGAGAGSVHYLAHLALAHHEKGESARGEALFLRALEQARALGVPAIEAAVRLVRGRVAIRRGDQAAAFGQVRTAAMLILALRDDRIGLDCVRSFAEVLLASGSGDERQVALALLNYVLHHPRTEAADRTAARVLLAQWRAPALAAAGLPAHVEVASVLRRIAARSAGARETALSVRAMLAAA